MRGLFLTFEGIEGCGKTTQIDLLANRLIEDGYSVITTREPGNGEFGRRIREVLLSVTSSLDPLTELFLLAADRTRHVIELIQPALNDGQIVISDRYSDSSVAYQGYGRGLDLNFVHQINETATDHCYPDLTLVLDVSPEIGLERSRIRLRQQDMFEAEGRFEQENLNFHKRVRDGYLKIEQLNRNRVKIVDASLDIQKMEFQIRDIVFERVDAWVRNNKND